MRLSPRTRPGWKLTVRRVSAGSSHAAVMAPRDCICVETAALVQCSDTLLRSADAIAPLAGVQTPLFGQAELDALQQALGNGPWADYPTGGVGQLAVEATQTLYDLLVVALTQLQEGVFALRWAAGEYAQADQAAQTAMGG